MELRRPCKMMSTDQWERRIPVSWSSSAFWLVEPAAGHKNAHQHEWAAILHYLGPFAAYFAPTLPLPLFIINHFIAPIMIPQLNHQKIGTIDGICPNFGFVPMIMRVFVAQWSQVIWKVQNDCRCRKLSSAWESESWPDCWLSQGSFIYLSSTLAPWLYIC